jgi:hypothetical protein
MLADETSSTNRAAPARSRRRRKFPASSGHEKENRNASLDRRKDLNKSSSTNTVENEVGGFDDESVAFGTSLERGDQRATASLPLLDEILCDDGSTIFRQALLNVTVSSPLWENNPNLVNVLISASLFKTASSYMFLYEHSTPLTNLTRKLIKDVTTNDGGDQQRKQLDNLYIAVHILRAIAFVHATTSMERKESLLKLFYHLINTASSINRATKTMDGSIVVRAGLIALAGYEGLGRVLSVYSTHSQDSNQQQLIHFDLVKDSDTHQRILFSVPSRKINHGKKGKDATIGSMSRRQLSTIALQTTSAVCNVILSFFNPSIKNRIHHSQPLCYGSIGYIVSDNMERLHSVLVELSRRVHEPWLLFLAQSSLDEPELAKEVVSYAKGIHRLVWDAATQLKSASEDETIGMEIECLQLRKVAIELLLPTTSVVHVDKLIRTYLFESACTYAWKAATVFFQCSSQSSPISSASKSEIAKFYKDLDSTFQKDLIGNYAIPLGFVEYVAYQSLHVQFVFGGLISADFIEGDGIASQKTMLEGDYRVLLRTLILGILVRQTIEFDEVSTSQILVGNGERHLDCMEQVTRDFNEQITKNWGKFTPDIRSRIFKVMASLSLQKTLFMVLKMSKEKLSFIKPTVVVGTKILIDCLGPFAVGCSRISKDKSDHLFDLIVECYIRPIAVFRHLRNYEFLDPLTYKTMVGAACRELYIIILDGNFFIKCIEKAAKVSD